MIMKTPLPKISVVTPCFNHEGFIEDTIQSVLRQKYDNLEYIIIDGGSTDGSVEVIRKYEEDLTFWVSEKDDGQSHALNKGFARAPGDIFCWINSDDMFAPNALHEVARIFSESQCDILSGVTVYIDSVGNHCELKKPIDLSVDEMLKTYRCNSPQPSTFWSKNAWGRYGPLDENLHFRMDYPLFMCFKASEMRWIFSEKKLALFRRHEEQKTWSWADPRFHGEREASIKRFASYDDFAEHFARSIDRGLKYEGWLVSWLALNNI
jgi:glycosyltransferase involved in cell wall biosynthesis